MDFRGELVIRQAVAADIPSLIALFADDAVGGHGDTRDPAALPDYEAAFRRIVESPNDMLYVAELGGDVVGTFQTTLTTSMTARGATNLTIEAVQTRADLRGRGIGAAMIGFAIQKAREADVRLVQLTSNSKREAAHRFYRRLGFSQSHAGFKMKLT
ncbi:MAG TPA: GNAT family N-acetyltransferase [Rhizobiaceae bacterium]|nr:GNAT family N-acetyltransferase [Rhizobiaceae bacterium]